MCQFCSADCTDYRCSQCERDEREFLAHPHRQQAVNNVRQAVQGLTPIFGLANIPTYMEEFAAS